MHLITDQNKCGKPIELKSRQPNNIFEELNTVSLLLVELAKQKQTKRVWKA